jgi:enoyl-CoA hydratase
VAYENLLVERDGDIAVVTINRPKVLNALNVATVRVIVAVVAELEADASVRAVVFTGAGERAFVAGADINELRAIESAVEAERFARYGQSVFARLEKMEKPVIMAINGFALGGGCELAMAGDIRIAADTAKLGQPEVNLGIFPGYGGTQRLPRLVGTGTAKLLIMSGETIDAQEAFRIGLVDRVVPAAELLATAKNLAKQLAAKAPVALALAKKAIDLGTQTDLERGCALEASLFGLVASTEDRVEGTGAFLEKRKPTFKGR